MVPISAAMAQSDGQPTASRPTSDSAGAMRRPHAAGGRSRAVGAALLILALLLAGASAWGIDDSGRRVLHVGPQRALKQPSDAAPVARSGDIVAIDGGDYYGDVAVWPQNGLSLRGVDGRAHLHAHGHAAEAKAIWVIKGDDVEVDNIEFSGARVRDLNGAGIRAEGAGLSVRNCAFHDNEMGILTSNNPASELSILDSEFHHNTVDYRRLGRLGHNIYVGRIGRFTLRNSRVYGAETGHQVKTRARRNEIVGNRIYDGDGASSYLIDIAEGGDAVVADNHLQQSARAPNRSAISFAAEARNKSAGGSLEVRGNHFVNSGGRGTFVNNHAQVPAVLVGNELIGKVTPLRGPGSVR